MDEILDGVADLAALLAPIPGDRPQGADPRSDYTPNSAYSRLKDARMEARRTERRQEAKDSDGDTASADWTPVLKLAPKVLAEQAKDLDVASWLAEALLRAHGIDGLTRGLAVLRGLIEAFWPALHPEPEPGEGVEATLAPLAALNGVGGAGSLIQPLRLTALTDGQDGTRFALWQMEQAVALASLGDPAKREQRIRAGAPTTEAIEESAKATPPAFYRALLPSLDRCRAELAALDTVLQDKAGADAPGLSDIRAVLDLLRGSAAGLAKLVLPAEPEPAPAAPAAADILEEPGAAPPASAVARGPGFALPSGGTIANREDALRVLEAVAVWFRQTEPQSPIAYTLDELIRRARMPFIDLLAELLPDEQARRGLLTAAGINGARAEGG